MTPAQRSDLVHAPLADWARTRGASIAIAVADAAAGSTQAITFAALNDAVTQRAAALCRAHASATMLIHPSQPVADRLVEFLGIVASGRCAAVADPDWPASVLQTVAAAIPRAPCSAHRAAPHDAFYVGFTSGSTGMPKGFRRNHLSWAESFRVCLQDFGPAVNGRILAPGRDSHSLFLFGMLLGLWTGAGVVVQEKFSAAVALNTLRQGLTPNLIAVPGQLLMIMELARHRKLPPMDAVRLIMVSGARWPRERSAELRALFPCARLIEFYGASETSFISWLESADDAPTATVGKPFSNVALQIRDPDRDGVGMIYVRSPMVFMDYFLASDHTAALRDGEWLSVRDLGSVDKAGHLRLSGRQSRMIVTQGKNLFAEELETVLESHPAVASASVLGLADATRGASVAAIVCWSDSGAAAPPTTLELAAWCRRSLEAYKAPKKIWVCRQWPLTASGKTDHQRLAASLLAKRGNTPASVENLLPCLSPLR